jgi:hypothetical protein
VSDIVSGINGVTAAPIYTTATASSIVLADRAVNHTPQLSQTGSGSWAASGSFTVESLPTIDSGLTLAARIGLRHRAHQGAGAITSDVAVEVAALLGGTTNRALRSAITSNGTVSYCIEDTGGAPSKFVGPLLRSYTPGSQTIPTGFGVIHPSPLTLTGSQAWTLVGTASVVIVGS